MAFSKCNCTACSGHIEFETSNVGNIITCPHCNLETVLYEVKATPVARLAPHQPSRQEEPPTISRFESVVFGVTRFFVLGLSGLVVIALGLLVLTFASTLLKERKDRVVSYEEVSTSLIPTSHQSSQPSPSTTARGVKIPQSVQEALPKNGEALEKLLEDVAADEQQAFINNLSEIISRAKAAGVGAAKMPGIVDRYKSLWEWKLKTEQAGQTARLIARTSAIATAFGLLLVLTTLSMVLVLMAIERNTRPSRKG